MLLRTFPKTQSDREFLDGIATSDNRNFANMWGQPKDDGVPVFIYIRAGGFKAMETAFNNQNLTFETLIEDWQKYATSSMDRLMNSFPNLFIRCAQFFSPFRLIDDEKHQLVERKQNAISKDFDFETYHPFEEVFQTKRTFHQTHINSNKNQSNLQLKTPNLAWRFYKSQIILSKNNIESKFKLEVTFQIAYSNGLNPTMNSMRFLFICCIFFIIWKVEGFLKSEQETNPSQINVTSLGKTYEGRDILLTKVSKSGSSGDKPIIYVNCAIHAREWITTAVCNWMIRQVIIIKNPTAFWKLQIIQKYSATSQILFQSQRNQKKTFNH